MIKFIVSSSELTKALSLAWRVISKKGLPAMQCAHFNVEAGWLRLVATNYEVTINTTLEISNVEGIGGFNLSVDKLFNYIKTLTEQPLTFTIVETNVTVSALTGQVNMPTETVEEFPSMPSVLVDEPVFLPIPTLAHAISATAHSMDDTELRPRTRGIYLDFDTDRKSLSFVSTDGRVLTVYEIPFEASSPNLLILRSVIPIIKEIMEKKNESATAVIHANEQYVSIDFGQTTLTFRQPDGRFPPYRNVMPSPVGEPLVLDVKSLTSALNRTSVYDSEAHRVLFDITGNTLHLSAQDCEFSCSAEENLPCSFDRQIKIALNSDSLLGVLNSFPGIVKFYFTDPNKPVVIIPEKQTDGAQIAVTIMPMKYE